MKLPEGWFNGFDIQAYRKLVSLIPENGRLIEIGCYQGRSICSVAEILIERNIRVTLVDPFLKFSNNNAALKAADARLADSIYQLTGQDYRPDRMPEAGALDPECEKALHENLERFELVNRTTVVKQKSVDAANLFTLRQTQGKADMIFIDADHSRNGLIGDVYSWWPHLSDGGIMAGHDYVANGGTPMMREMRSALREIFGEDGVSKPTPRGTIWHAQRAPKFLTSLPASHYWGESEQYSSDVEEIGL